jgi:prophage regulatory protein
MSQPYLDFQQEINMSNTVQQGLAILRCKQVQARTGLARSTIYLNIKCGTFPRPVPLGTRAVGWLESEVSDWIAERVRIARGDAKSAR